MVRSAWICWLLVVLVLCAATPVQEPCTCTRAKVAGGWCEVHATGYVAGVEIHSRLLYDALDAHGHTLDLSTFKCPTCRQAIASDGFCEQHRVGFVSEQAYFSRLTYELARGEAKDPIEITCPVCLRNARSLGWCDKCGLGMIGYVAIKDRQAYERAAKAVEILQAATLTVKRCEWCAIAMVTDTQCPLCRISYKDGKPVTAPAKP